VCDNIKTYIFVCGHKHKTQMSELHVRKLSNKAILPQRGSHAAAGYDLSSAEDHVIIPSKSRAVVSTHISIALPPNTYGRIAPRSGLAVKKCIDVAAGVIDEDYRGVLGVVLCNHSDQSFGVKHGDRIAQLIIEKIEHPIVKETSDVSDSEWMNSTVRGMGSFGSTG